MLCYGRRVPLIEMQRRIGQLTAEDVRNVCSKYIMDKDVACAGVGKFVICYMVSRGMGFLDGVLVTMIIQRILLQDSL